MTGAWLGWRDIVSLPARALLAFTVVTGCAAVFAFTELSERARDAAVSDEIDGVAAPLLLVPSEPGGRDSAPRMLGRELEPHARSAAPADIRELEPWLVVEVKIGPVRASLVGVPPQARTAAQLPHDAVALGAALARRLGATSGTRLSIAGQLQRVIVLPTVGSADDAKAFMDLQGAQRLVGVPDGATEFRIRLWPGARVEEVRARLAKALPGTTVLRVDRGAVADIEMASAVRVHHLGVVVATALAALACLAVASFLDASERRLELASLVALGAARRHVVVALASRSAIVAALGAATGAIVAIAAAASLGDVFAVGSAAVPVFGASVSAAVLLGFTASLPTALVAAAQDPVQALQEIAA